MGAVDRIGPAAISDDAGTALSIAAGFASGSGVAAAILSKTTSRPSPNCGTAFAISKRLPAIRILKDSIFHVHAKDTQLYPANLVRTGVLDTKPYTDERNRGWIFRTCGYGHGAEWWKEFVSTLRMFRYDGVLSIEHEDSLLSPEEGLTKAVQFLNEVVMQEEPGKPWWV